MSNEGKVTGKDSVSPQINLQTLLEWSVFIFESYIMVRYTENNQKILMLVFIENKIASFHPLRPLFG